ncbi:MAG: NUDIX hydrolase [Spirochaetales bacterium]|nr:NUDIX hydrolase [Spirochaetales bacterium]
MDEIKDLLIRYKKDFPLEAESVELFRAFAEQKGSLSRAQRIGHFTASAWIVNRDRSKTLLTHHAKLDMWLQPGGHIEEGEDLHTAALREAAEESGLESVHLVFRDLFDIDAHLIPERKGEEAHYHFDLRFLMEADSDETLKISAESKDLKWVRMEDVEKYNRNASVMRMAGKMNGNSLRRM